MFSDLTDIQKYLLWKVIKYAIDNNSGIGFANNDQGHPAYAGPSDADEETWGDSPNKNELYKMLSILDKQFREEGQPDLSTWEGFCKFAFDANNKTRPRPN